MFVVFQYYTVGIQDYTTVLLRLVVILKLLLRIRYYSMKFIRTYHGLLSANALVMYVIIIRVKTKVSIIIVYVLLEVVFYCRTITKMNEARRRCNK